MPSFVNCLSACAIKTEDMGQGGGGYNCEPLHTCIVFPYFIVVANVNKYTSRDISIHLGLSNSFRSLVTLQCTRFCPSRISNRRFVHVHVQNNVPVAEGKK